MPTAQVNGIDLYYVEQGQGENLVLIHNLISSVHGYDFNIPELSRYYRTLAYDQRGHGRSSKPSSGYDFETMAEDLYQLLMEMEIETCHLLGTAAIGTGVLWRFFTRHPEMVRSLMSISGARGVVRQTPHPEDFVHLQQTAAREGMAAVLEERKHTMTMWTPKILTTPEIWDRFVEMYQQTSVDAFVALPEMVGEEARQQTLAQLARHPVPVLFLEGIARINDPRFEETVAEMRKVCPRFRAVVIPDSGHYPAIENPQDFNGAILDFLAGVNAYA